MKVFCFCLCLTLCCVAYSQTGPRFDTPRGPVILDPPTGGITSPCLSEDELEIFFESLGNLWHAKRTSTSVAFENPVPVAELNTIDFGEERPYLSADGLSLYFTRFQSGALKSRRVYCAQRWSPSLSFLAPKEVGIEGLDYFDGALGSVSRDERTLYLSVVQPDSTSTLANETDIAIATRTNKSERFGMWRFVSEASSDNFERGPSIDRNETSLYFSVVGVGIPGYLYWSGREDRDLPFSPPSLVNGVNGGGAINRDPFIAFPGSRLYYVRNNQLVVSDRKLSASYRIGQGTGVSGRRLLVPVRLTTSEPDAILFEVPIFFNPTLITLERIVPGPGLGVEDVEIVEISQGRYRIVYQSEEPLDGEGLEEKVFDLEFAVGLETPPGQVSIAPAGTFRVNRIGVSPPVENGRVVVEEGPGYPPASLLRIH